MNEWLNCVLMLTLLFSLLNTSSMISRVIFKFGYVKTSDTNHFTTVHDRFQQCSWAHAMISTVEFCPLLVQAPGLQACKSQQNYRFLYTVFNEIKIDLIYWFIIYWFIYLIWFAQFMFYAACQLHLKWSCNTNYINCYKKCYFTGQRALNSTLNHDSCSLVLVVFFCTKQRFQV